MACLILGLEYCHTNNIIHRDIKPENLVLDCKGYVKITDFGIAKQYQKDNLNETSGTPGYMAPEVMNGKNHTLAVDYFALGVIGYEFMNGTRPYLGKNRSEIKEKIINKQAQIKKNEIPSDWSLESADCINRLLQRKANNRLGLRGAGEVKEHSWFKYYAWKDLYLGKIISPFIPNSSENYDQKYCNKPDKVGFDTQNRYMTIKGSSVYQHAFKDYAYFNRWIHESQNQNNQNNDFINPHLVYFEEIEGNMNENDACVINRNIFNKKSSDEFLCNKIKKIPGQGQSSLFMMYSSYNKNIKSAHMNLSKGNSSSSNKNNMDMSILSSCTTKKHSYCQGNNYNF